MSKTKKKAEKVISIINSLWLATNSRATDVTATIIEEDSTEDSDADSSALSHPNPVPASMADMVVPNEGSFTKETIDPLSGTNKEPVSVPYVTMANFLNGEFPWQIGDKGISICAPCNDFYTMGTNLLLSFLKVEYAKKHRLVDTWMLVERYREEIDLTKKEMTNFISSTEKKITIIKAAIQEIMQLMSTDDSSSDKVTHMMV